MESQFDAVAEGFREMVVVRCGVLRGRGGGVVGGRAVKDEGREPFKEEGKGAAKGQGGSWRGDSLAEGCEALCIVFAKS